MESRKVKARNIYTKFVGCFTKNGKMNKTATFVISSIANASRELKYKIKGLDIIVKLVRVLGVVVEIKTVKIRNTLFTVPIPANESRRNYLIIKKLSDAISSNKSRITWEKKLTQEILSIIKNKNPKSIADRDFVLKEAIKNKSNSHFRW